MRLFNMVTFRSMSSRRLRSFLTLSGIILGVAAMFAINNVNEKAFSSITALFEGTSGKVDLEVRSASSIGEFDEGILETIGEFSGVEKAVPVLQISAALPAEGEEDVSLDFFGMGSGGILVYGIDPLADQDIRDYRITEGSFLNKEPDAPEIVLVEDYARDEDIKVGTTVSFLTEKGLSDFRVIGFMAKEGAGLTNLGKFGVMDLHEVQKILEGEGKINRIDVTVTNPDGDPEEMDALRDELSLALGEGYEVKFPGAEGQEMNQMLSGYQISLNFMAGIALFVGAFLIYNALSMTVAERNHEFGLLRCVGMTRRQIMLQVILEGLILGLAGAMIGAVAGILLSEGLSVFMARILGQELERGVISTSILISSMLVGIVVTLISAVVPAIKAGKSSPVQALQGGRQGKSGEPHKSIWMLGILLLLVSAGILIWNPFPYDVQFRLGSITVFALFLGATFTIPITINAWQWITRWPFRKVFGSIGEIGSRNIKRSRNRTMLTAAALMVGVAMIVSTQGITGSFRTDLNEWMNAYLGSDIFISSSVPLTRELTDELMAMDSVAIASPLRTVSVTLLNGEKEEKISFMGIEPLSYTEITDFVYSQEGDHEEAVLQLDQGGFIFVSEVIATKYGVGIGEEIFLKTNEGRQGFKVADVILDYTGQGMVVTGNLSDLERYFGVDDVDTLYVNATEGADLDETVQLIKEEFQDEYSFIIEPNSALKERADNLMNQAFSMFDVLGVLAVMVAALGVVNTLSMSVVERTQEIGMLRSIGMTRFQVVRMIQAEAGLLGIIGGVLGLGLGLVLTYILLAAMGTMSGYELEFVLPRQALWQSVVVAVITSQLAALIPALRAAKIPMLSAIHYE